MTLSKLMDVKRTRGKSAMLLLPFIRKGDRLRRSTLQQLVTSAAAHTRQREEREGHGLGGHHIEVHWNLLYCSECGFYNVVFVESYEIGFSGKDDNSLIHAVFLYHTDMMLQMCVTSIKPVSKVWQQKGRSLCTEYNNRIICFIFILSNNYFFEYLTVEII